MKKIFFTVMLLFSFVLICNVSESVADNGDLKKFFALAQQTLAMVCPRTTGRH